MPSHVKVNPRVDSVALAQTWISGAETATLPKRSQQQKMWWCQLLHEVKNYGFSLHLFHIICDKVYLQTSMALPFQSPLHPCLSQKSQLFSCSSCTKMVLEFKRQVFSWGPWSFQIDMIHCRGHSPVACTKKFLLLSLNCGLALQYDWKRMYLYIVYMALTSAKIMFNINAW